MIAALPMYDLAAMQPANDRFWALIRDNLRTFSIAAPDALSRGADDLWPIWEAPDLVLAQTCGLPYRTRLHGRVTLIGTPDYGVDGCPPGYYRSLFVIRGDDMRRRVEEFAEARFVYNDGSSQSGWGVAQNHAAGMGFRFAASLRSGAHQLSAQAVLRGDADIAAIDAVTWSLLCEHQPEVRALQVIGATEPTPGLPYITAQDTDPEPFFEAISGAIAATGPADRDTLRLRGLVRVDAAAYLAVPTPPGP